jgi:hypothetical protein
METEEHQAELIDGPQGLPSDQYINQMYQQPQMYPQQMMNQNDLFSRPNDLRLIQEYNNEETVPIKMRTEMWGMMVKSLKLGFWEKDDAQEIFLHKNTIRVGYLLSTPKHKYTFKDRNNLNMIDFLSYADFKRGVGMEKYKINERTLQSTSITQALQGISGNSSKKGGVFSGLKAFFG